MGRCQWINEVCYYKRIQPMGGKQSNLLAINSPDIEDISLVPYLRIPFAYLFVDGMLSITWWWC